MTHSRSRLTRRVQPAAEGCWVGRRGTAAANPAQDQPARDDVESIYDLLTGISATQAKHSARFDSVDARFSAIEGRQLRHGNRLDELDTHLASIRSTQQRHGNRLDTLDAKADEQGNKLDEHTAKLDEILDLLRPDER